MIFSSKYFSFMRVFFSKHTPKGCLFFNLMLKAMFFFSKHTRRGCLFFNLVLKAE